MSSTVLLGSLGVSCLVLKLCPLRDHSAMELCRQLGLLDRRILELDGVKVENKVLAWAAKSEDGWRVVGLPQSRASRFSKLMVS